MQVVLLQHPNSEMHNIASKVVATVSVDDVKENVNLYLDSGNLFQLTKKYLFATLVPVPISECKIKLYISTFIVYKNKLDIYFLVQTYFSIEKDIRKLFSNLFIFKVSKHEINTIYDELIEHKLEYVDEIIKLVYDKPFNFMFINTDTQRIFKNFDELIIED